VTQIRKSVKGSEMAKDAPIDFAKARPRHLTKHRKAATKKDSEVQEEAVRVAAVLARGELGVRTIRDRCRTTRPSALLIAAAPGSSLRPIAAFNIHDSEYEALSANEDNLEPQLHRSQPRLRIWCRVQLRRCTFPSVLLSMLFGRFLGVVERMESMSCGDFRMVRGLLMAVGFVMLRRLAMVFCCELVMFSRLLVVISTFMSCHVLSSF
jgi:hypothetical protein